MIMLRQALYVKEFLLADDGLVGATGSRPSSESIFAVVLCDMFISFRFLRSRACWHGSRMSKIRLQRLGSSGRNSEPNHSAQTEAALKPSLWDERRMA